jgi:hypothetical protein
MTRLLTAFSCLGLLISATGCCCHHFGGGGACPPPCGPCGSNYGGYPAFSQAYVQPAYATASIASTGFVTAAAPGCDCAPGAPAIAPY